MSKNKSGKASKATVSSIDNSKVVDNAQTDSVGLDEDSFKNLRIKISAQLKSTDSKAAGKVRELSDTYQKDQKPLRGKKRSADGSILPGKNERKSDASKIIQKTPPEVKVNGDEEQLRTVLKELGGTQEDLDLIAGADSESELEGLDNEQSTQMDSRKKKGSNLQDGIANILKEIALAKGDQDEDAVNSEEEDGVNESGSKPEPEDGKSAQKTPTPVTAEKPSKKLKGNARLKYQPRADWYNSPTTVFDNEVKPKYKPSQQSIDQLQAYAKSLLTADNETFKSTQQSSSSQAFYNTVIASGTLSDKISALTLAVQESPIHNIKALESLIALAGKRSRAQAIDVLRSLKDLLAQGSLLPGDRRLYTFASQPALLLALGQVKSWKQGDRLPLGIQESDLIYWAFEDWLKQQYFEILKILEIWCNDEIEFAKGRAISYIFELLKERPEQESNLLRLLINKLGDPVKKIASQASYLIMQLLATHPAMKMIVISAIESDFIFRPGQSMHGKYYAAVTLNQTALSTREEEVAKLLLGIYFSLFTTLLKPSDQQQVVEEQVDSQSRAQRQRQKKPKPIENAQGEELREKLISAVLTGVNRAYPYVGPEQRTFTDHLETLFKITHSANFNTSIQAMLLIQQLTSTHSASADRFYRTLYESLLDPRLITASKQQLYLNLLHKSLKTDMSTKRVKAFVKRLLQIVSLHEPSFVCGVFFLLQDLEKTYPSLTALLEQAEDHEDDEEVFRDVDEDTERPDVPGLSSTQSHRYDGSKRAPEHANADNSCTWEVLPYLAHFHPAVTVSADHYIQHSKLPGKPDLTLHTLIHFLDRFVYRNPKLSSNKLRGSSIMQPMASDDTNAVLISSNVRKIAPSINTEAFRNKKDEDVAAEDAFFHKYFSTLGKDVKQKQRKPAEIDEDGSIGDAGEDAVWKAMIDSAPDLEGEGSDEEDLDMSEFEDEMDDEGESVGEGDMNFDDDDDDEGESVDIEAGIFDDSDDDMVNDEAAVQIGAPDSESEFGGLDSDVEEEDTPAKKQKREKKEKRKKMKALPTFASAADYAKMLGDDEDEDLG